MVKGVGYALLEITAFLPVFQDIELFFQSPGAQPNPRSLWFSEKPTEKEKIDTFPISTIGPYIACKT